MDREVGIESKDYRTKSQEPGIKTKDKRQKSKDKRTKSQEPRIKTKDQRSKIKEQRD